jgi:hypothetical protein
VTEKARKHVWRRFPTCFVSSCVAVFLSAALAPPFNHLPRHCGCWNIFYIINYSSLKKSIEIQSNAAILTNGRVVLRWAQLIKFTPNGLDLFHTTTEKQSTSLNKSYEVYNNDKSN